MDVHFRYCTYDELAPLKRRCTDQTDFKYYPDCVYIGAFVDDSIVGVAGWMLMGDNLRWKGSYVLPEYRNNGIYAALFKLRKQVAARIPHRFVSGWSSEMNIHRYRREGFEILTRNKNGCYYVKKEGLYTK